MKAKTLFFSFILSCFLIPVGAQNDYIFFNGRIYTADADFNVHEAMVVKDGKIVAIGFNKDIMARYAANEQIDLKGRAVYPGFYDAHAHFVGYARNMNQADLIGTKSKEDIIARLKAFALSHPEGWLTGRGWDQNDWADKQYPSVADLDSIFPDRPVYLVRIDGHAAWVNSAALRLAGISRKTKVKGGEVLLENRKPTGILIDNATDLVSRIIPPVARPEMIRSLQKAEEDCFSFGITSLADAGLPYADVMLLDSMQKADLLRLRIYAMLTPEEENFKMFVSKGIYKTDRLHVRSIKVYADGALGSRGACLLDSYADRHKHHGLLFHSYDEVLQICQRAASFGYQVNTHCIGDSAHRTVLMAYAKATGSIPDHRWRIEHAQVTFPSDLAFYKAYKIIPSVQPTHATSDMYWAAERLGEQRMKTAYTYKQLLDNRGLIALGTDFPVEGLNPVNTFYAAVVRKDLKGYPENGFQKENALSRIETLKGMTIWAAYSAFEEKEKGSLEVGKFADFVILDRDIMEVPEAEIPAAKVLMTVSGGKIVYTRL